MTRFLQDQFPKEYLKELLKPMGLTETGQELASEVQQIDVCFSPKPQPNQDQEQKELGLLGRFASTPAIFEPFRSPVKKNEVLSCLGKLFNVNRLSQRTLRKKRKLSDRELHHLWILTPTASPDFLASFGASPDEENWDPGVYFLPESLKTAIVVIHQLPQNPDTLWLRILGKGKVQQQAINELKAIPESPRRENTLELLYNLFHLLEVRQDVEPDDQELIMKLSPLYTQRLEAATEQGLQQGLQQGERQTTRRFITNLLEVRFSQVDEELTTVIEPLMELPTEELTPLLLQLSREELLARFGNEN